MHNIRPAGQMWHAEALIWPAKHKMLWLQLVFLTNSPVNGWKHYTLALGYKQKFFLAHHENKLCIPELEDRSHQKAYLQTLIRKIAYRRPHLTMDACITNTDWCYWICRRKKCGAYARAINFVTLFTVWWSGLFVS